MKKQITISIFAREELKARFEEAYRDSEMNSKAEFLTSLLEAYLNPDPGQVNDRSEELDDLQTEVKEKDQLIVDLQEKISQLEIREPDLQTAKEASGSKIILQTTEQQREILVKCYDKQEDLGKLILQDLVKMALQWVQVEKGGLFSNDRYNRLFLVKGIASEEFQVAFADEIDVIVKQDQAG